MSPRRTLGVVVPVGGNGIDEGLIVSILTARGHEGRLAAGTEGAGMTSAEHLNNHHRDTLEKIFSHASSGDPARAPARLNS